MPTPTKLPWLRLYVELPTDPKIRRLRKGDYKWLYIVLLVLARKSPVPGVLLVTDDDAVDIDDLADMADLDPRVVRNGLAAMEKQGLIVVDLDHDTHRIAAWDRRQFKSDHDARERQQRSRGRRQS